MATNPKAFSGRRYISRKETTGYILFDMATSVNIDGQESMFLERILNLDLVIQATIKTFIIGAWDIINDLWFSTIVDKTRTRFGKFRPYLILSLVGSTPFKAFYYLMPVLFWNTAPNYMPKVIAYLIFGILNETAKTFNDVSRSGMIATLTPNPNERASLITFSQFLSGILGGNLPSILMGLFISIFNESDVPQLEIELKIRGLFLVFGVGTAILSGIFALYFAVVSKERVPQTVFQPKLRESFKAVLRNRLLLAMSISDLLGSFNIGGSESTYYNAVLKFPIGQTIAGIPGFFTSNLSYIFIPKARERFSTKALWIASNHTEPVLSIIVYFLGLLKMKNPIEHRVTPIYTNVFGIIPMLAVREVIWAPLISLRNVLNKDMMNECMDYGEWKNGLRNEAMIAALKGIVTKMSKIIFDGINTMLRAAVGFRTGLNYTNQPLHVQKFVFAMFMLYPSLTGGMLSLIPKLFYNLGKEERDQMYSDLAERRVRISEEMMLAQDSAEQKTS